MDASADPWFAITWLVIMLVIVAVIVLADWQWRGHSARPDRAHGRGGRHWWGHSRHGRR